MSTYVDGDGQLVIDGQIVCPCCLEDLPRCEAVHDEPAELAAEAKAAPVLTVRLGGAA